MKKYINVTYKSLKTSYIEGTFERHKTTVIICNIYCMFTAIHAAMDSFALLLNMYLLMRNEYPH